MIGRGYRQGTVQAPKFGRLVWNGVIVPALFWVIEKGYCVLFLKLRKRLGVWKVLVEHQKDEKVGLEQHNV